MVGWTEEQREQADDGERFVHGLLWALAITFGWLVLAAIGIWLVLR